MDIGIPEGDEQQITAVEVAGFKSAISLVRVNLRGITILAGANSTGKSTVMQPLLLIKQTMEKPFDPGGLAIDGPLVKFTQANQIFSYRKSKMAEPAFSLTLVQAKFRVKLSYGRKSAGGVGINEMAFVINGKDYLWVNNQILDINHEFFSNSRRDRMLQAALAGAMDADNEIRICTDRAVLAAGIALRASPQSASTAPIFSPASGVVQNLQRMIYLPGLRGNPERQYSVSAAGPQYPGSFNDYVASIIHRWGVGRDGRLKNLGDNLKMLGLTSLVTTEAVDDTRVEVRVGRLPVSARGDARDTVNIADVGFGVSQTLPVLVALLAASPGQIVFIEQPELHLHPKAQVKLADIMLEAVHRGVRIIMETHSSLLLLAVQRLIAEGQIAPERVSMNWFTRDNTGQTHVAEAELARDGSYGDWPVDFDDIEADLQNRYLNLVDRLRAEG